jgi:hypothetical protein
MTVLRQSMAGVVGPRIPVRQVDGLLVTAILGEPDLESLVGERLL